VRQSIGERAPRHWAADIIAGIATIDQAPKKYRELVQEHVDGHHAQVEFWIRHVLAGASREIRRGRLDSCPPAFRTEVAHTARREWAEKQQQSADGAGG